MNNHKGGVANSEGWPAVVDTLATQAAAVIAEFEQIHSVHGLNGEFRKEFFDTMDDLWLEGANTLQRLFPNCEPAIKKYYLEKISPVLAGSVFYERARRKPRGYPGDYLTMDMIYCGTPLPAEGKQPLSAALDEWFLNTPSARACRSRHEWLAARLNDVCANGGRRVASLAGGPCREISTFLEGRSESGHSLEFEVFDFDDEALAYAHNLLKSHLSKTLSCIFERVNIMKVALRGKPIGTRGGFDVVYCTGFADYLDDECLARMLSSAYESLVRGGRLLLAQFLDVPNHPDRNAMRWGMDWNLIYRNEDQLIQAFSQSGFGSELQIHTDPLGLIAFCEATKPQ